LFNIDKVFPDHDPPISGENLSSLRILIPESPGLISGSNELVREVKPSILTGISTLGGIWTFITSIFSLVFGSPLLLVLFGKSSLFLL